MSMGVLVNIENSTLDEFVRERKWLASCRIQVELHLKLKQTKQKKNSRGLKTVSSGTPSSGPVTWTLPMLSNVSSLPGTAKQNKNSALTCKDAVSLLIFEIFFSCLSQTLY